MANVEYTSLVQCRGWPAQPDRRNRLARFRTAGHVLLYSALCRHGRYAQIFHAIGDHFEFNRASARWAFDYVDFHAQVVYSEAIEDVKKAQLEYEAGAVAKTAEIDKQAQELYAKTRRRRANF